MKISASIYSDKFRSLEEVVNDLVDHKVDLLHVDCNDNPSVFEDIAFIRTICDLPIDLHLITDEPEKYYDLLRANPVEYLTFQHENLKKDLNIPSDITGKKGIAVITPTEVSIFEAYSDFDFILIMATIPGQSGGQFDKVNFDKIRQFRTKYPKKSIHVDGGVNAEVSFILRNMGVTSAVSGSYLFKEASIGNALMNLTKRPAESHYQIADFMRPLDECPVVREKDLSLPRVLQTIEDGALGFTLVTEESGKLAGLISNADVRRGLLRHLDNLNELMAQELMNTNPVLIEQSSTVYELLVKIEKTDFPVLYVPVVDEHGNAKGIVTFVHLIKGEL